MHTADESACVGTQRVRALLASDRNAANEVRPDRAHTRLQTTDYTLPLRARIRRRFREDDRVRIGSLVASAGLVLAVLGVVTLGAGKTSPAAARAPALVNQEVEHARNATVLVSHQPPAAAALDAPVHEPTPAGDRLQRARRVLRRQGAEGAAKARVLLEELLLANPRNGRAYAALAQACLHLQDARCARNAVTKAVARQPRRVKYRALAARIDRTFAREGE